MTHEIVSEISTYVLKNKLDVYLKNRLQQRFRLNYRREKKKRGSYSILKGYKWYRPYRMEK